MSKTTYRATFSNGQSFERKSHRPYAFAWSLPVDRPDWKGFCTPSFARTRELAEKAAEHHRRCYTLNDATGPIEIVPVEIINNGGRA